MEKRVSYYSSSKDKGNLGTKDTPFSLRHLRPQLSATFATLLGRGNKNIKHFIAQSENQTHNRRSYRRHDGLTYYLPHKNNVKI